MATGLTAPRSCLKACRPTDAGHRFCQHKSVIHRDSYSRWRLVGRKHFLSGASQIAGLCGVNRSNKRGVRFGVGNKSNCPIVDTFWQTETGGHMRFCRCDDPKSGNAVLGCAACCAGPAIRRRNPRQRRKAACCASKTTGPVRCASRAIMSVSKRHILVIGLLFLR
jgi:hypothetical protein